MSHEFINPNWHIILIHYPIGLLTIGLLIEIITAFHRASTFRAAGRWMIAIGGMLTIPTLTAGLYAFRDTVSPTGFMMDEHWREVVAESKWNDEQWRFISRHILFNSIATGLAVLTVFLWLANSERVRRKTYWLLLLALIAANVLLGIGAWHGGELVYRFGTGVQAVHPNPPTAEPVQHNVDYYASPLQVHIIAAGLAVAAIVVSIGLMFRKWEKPGIADVRGTERRASDPLDTGVDEEVLVPEVPRVFPGRFFIAACALGIVTAFLGAWSVMGDFTGEALKSNLEMLKEADHRRLLIHVIVGVCIVLLPVVLAIVVRFMGRGRALGLLLVVVLLIAVGLQLWLGIAMLYDSHEGPMFRFATGTEAEEPAEHGHEHGGAATMPSSTSRPVHAHGAATTRTE